MKISAAGRGSDRLVDGDGGWGCERAMVLGAGWWVMGKRKRRSQGAEVGAEGGAITAITGEGGRASQGEEDESFKRPVRRINTFGPRSPHRSEGGMGGMKILVLEKIGKGKKEKKFKFHQRRV